MDDIQQFYRERSVLEKEHGAKLNALAKKYFEKKSKKSSSLSVGDTPALTPGSLERSALYLCAYGGEMLILPRFTVHHSLPGPPNSAPSNLEPPSMSDSEASLSRILPILSKHWPLDMKIFEKDMPNMPRSWRKSGTVRTTT